MLLSLKQRGKIQKENNVKLMKRLSHFSIVKIKLHSAKSFNYEYSLTSNLFPIALKSNLLLNLKKMFQFKTQSIVCIQLSNFNSYAYYVI